MKLNEIKTVSTGHYELNEGVIPVVITMTLEQVISAGKITNNVQNFIMAGLISMFKDGGPTRWPRDINSYAMATSSDLVEAVKTLTDIEAVGMANWLLQQLMRPASFESNPSRAPQMAMNDWVKMVVSRQE